MISKVYINVRPIKALKGQDGSLSSPNTRRMITQSANFGSSSTK